jgi:hypothetical protein
MVGLGERTLGREPCDGDTPMPFLEDLAALVAAPAYRFYDEYDLQSAVGGVLRGEGYHVRAEHRLGPRDRPDFMVGDDGHAVAVEIKVAGQAAAVGRQLARYAAHAAVAEVLLVTCMERHRGVPREVHGKPVRVVVVRSA